MSTRKRTTTTYLSTGEFAERVGVKRDTLNRYKLPEPDAVIGTTRGWLPATIDAWQAARPGRGNFTPGADRPWLNNPRPGGQNREQALGVIVIGDGAVSRRCPRCGDVLTRDPLRPASVFRCPAGHTFEVGREVTS